MLVYDASFDDLISFLRDWGYEPYRAKQIWEGLYQHFWNSSDFFTNLPLSLRSELAEKVEFQALTPTRFVKSSDGNTIKYLFKLVDGNSIETVLMRYQKRNTICVSTQVGCAMGCIFCATGKMGFKRNLSVGEIVAQVIYFANQLNSLGGKVTNLVFMGMGEPFHNYDNVLVAIDRLNDPRGFNISARRCTISTVGLIPGIQRFTSEKRQINLAISLHAADDNLRNTMIPINKRYPIDELLDAAREYVSFTGRRISFEWALVNKLNDTPAQARLLATKLKGLLCHVNAIPLNPITGYDGKATTHERANDFKAILEHSGITCTIRLRRGIEIQAGCGQLIVI